MNKIYYLESVIHDKVIRWNTDRLCGEFTGHRWIPRTKAIHAELSLICAWINSWVYTRKDGELRCNRAHYDVIVMAHFKMSMCYTNLFQTKCFGICTFLNHNLNTWKYMCNKLWVTLDMDFNGWCDSAMVFTSDAVSSENQCRIASGLTRKSPFTITHTLSHLLHASLCPGHTDLVKTISRLHFAIVVKDSLFRLTIVTSPQLTWCQANARY